MQYISGPNGMLFSIFILCSSAIGSDIPECIGNFKSCCEGYTWNPKTSACEVCMPGYFGLNCTKKCPFPTYGKRCQKLCKCNKDQCDMSTGCIGLNDMYTTLVSEGNTTPSMATHTSEADSCPVSKLTVQVVEECPDSEEKWREAAERKKCEDYATCCSEPERFKYHCVINSFINETLEVCAYTQFIVNGHCADYSISGNLIKWNSKTNCEAFMTKPCPIAYLSTEAYKYPGCYELTKQSKKPSANPDSESPKEKYLSEELARKNVLIIFLSILLAIPYFWYPIYQDIRRIIRLR